MDVPEMDTEQSSGNPAAVLGIIKHDNQTDPELEPWMKLPQDNIRFVQTP